MSEKINIYVVGHNREESLFVQKLYTLQLQQQQFELGKQFFLDGDYDHAEPTLRLVLESAFQHKDYETYVHCMTWLNRLFVNTAQFDKLYTMLLLIQPLIEKYGNRELFYFYRLHLIFFNAHYSLGDTISEYEDLFIELKETPFQHLYFIVGSNLVITYLNMNEINKAATLFEDMLPLSLSMAFPNKMTLYMHKIYGFLVYYTLEQYNKCELILNEIETNKNITIVEGFTYIYEICRALLVAIKGDFENGKRLFEKISNDPKQRNYIRYELKLWVKTLKKFKLHEDVIFYQNVIIELLEDQYALEIGKIRKEAIEERSRQFYEGRIFIDQLTGLKNRNYYEHTLSKQQKVKNYTLAVIDIDKFKHINDSYGHITGDDAIRFLATKLSNWAFKSDTSIIRYGGDEFIILLPYAFNEVEKHLYKLHEDVLTSTFYVKKRSIEIPISISMGVSYTSNHYVTIDQLFEVADAAIYTAKQQRGKIIVNRLKK